MYQIEPPFLHYSSSSSVNFIISMIKENFIKKFEIEYLKKFKLFDLDTKIIEAEDIINKDHNQLLPFSINKYSSIFW